MQRKFLAEQIETGCRVEKMREHDPRFHPGQLGAETKVGPMGEREVRVRVPSDIEGIRPVENIRVAVRGARPENDELAFLDLHSGDLGFSRRHT